MKILYMDTLNKELVERVCEYPEEFEAVMEWIEKSGHLVAVSVEGRPKWRTPPEK